MIEGVSVRLYHHFPTKAALFEAVFEQLHAEMLVASAEAAAAADGALEMLATGFGVFLDWVLEPEVQRILVTDAPAVLGLVRFVELERTRQRWCASCSAR